jgi:hypothetical protein
MVPGDGGEVAVHYPVHGAVAGRLQTLRLRPSHLVPFGRDLDIALNLKFPSSHGWILVSDSLFFLFALTTALERFGNTQI